MTEAAITLNPVEVCAAVRPIGTWHEWCKKMLAATSFEEKFGLLHCGFDVSVHEAPYMVSYTPLDRIKFYFGLADGWTNDRHFRDSGVLFPDELEYHCGYDGRGNVVKRRQSEQRQLLAKKAFDMLAMRFFKPWLEKRAEAMQYQRHESNYDQVFVESGLLSILMVFFRYAPDWLESWRISNLHNWNREETPQEKIVVRFLLAMPEVLWKWKETTIQSYYKEAEAQRIREQNAAGRTTVEAGKVWIAQVLANLGRLDLLEPLPIEPDDPCVRAIEQIALQSKFSSVYRLVLEDRPAASIEEAVLLGSKAAAFVLLLRTKWTERQRLEGIREAELAKREATWLAEQRAAEVTAAQEAITAATTRLSELGAMPSAN